MCYAHVMKKRRLINLGINLIAAAAIAESAFLQWFNNALPSTVEAHQIASFIPTSVNYSSVTVATNFSVSIVLFVAAGLFVLGGPSAKKKFLLLGTLLSGSVLVLWFMSAGLNFSVFTQLSNLANSNLFGPGVFAAALATIIGIVSLVISHKKAKPTATGQ